LDLIIYACLPLGSQKNKLIILGIEATGRQGAKTQAYVDIPSLLTGSRTGCIGVQNDTIFFSEPLSPRAFNPELCPTLKAIKAIQQFQEIMDTTCLWCNDRLNML
jgi:hypothetical protein